LGVKYALDFGTVQVDNDPSRYPGLENLIGAPGFTEVKRIGDARLFRLDACG
jgi:hypothetical protein